MLSNWLTEGLQDYNECVRITGVEHMSAEEFMQASLNTDLKNSLTALPPVQVPVHQ